MRIFPIVPLLLFLVFAGILGAACSNEEETKEEYESKVERELGKTDERLQELESQSEQATGDTKRKVEEEIAGLKDERAAVEGKLRDVRSSSGEEWKKLKPDIDRALSELDGQFDQANARLGRELAVTAEKVMGRSWDTAVRNRALDEDREVSHSYTGAEGASRMKSASKPCGSGSLDWSSSSYDRATKQAGFLLDELCAPVFSPSVTSTLAPRGQPTRLLMSVFASTVITLTSPSRSAVA